MPNRSIRTHPEDISGIAGIEGILGIADIADTLFLAFLTAEFSGIKLLTSTLFLPAVFIWLDGGKSFLLVAKQGVKRGLGSRGSVGRVLHAGFRGSVGRVLHARLRGSLQGSRGSVGRVLHARLRPSAVSTTGIDVVTLLGRGADASTIAREARVAALGLALVILEEEQAVGTHLNLGALQGLIRSRSTP